MIVGEKLCCWRAWLVRFGRTAAGHAADAIGARFGEGGGGSRATFAGLRLWGAGGVGADGPDGDLFAPGIEFRLTWRPGAREPLPGAAGLGLHLEAECPADGTRRAEGRAEGAVGRRVGAPPRRRRRGVAVFAGRAI